MGALTSKRKRGDDSITVNFKSPVSNSPFSEIHVSKKRRLLISTNQATDVPNRVDAYFNFFRYPVSKSKFKREPHAPVRRYRVLNSVNLKKTGSQVSYVDNSAQGMGNLFSWRPKRYESAKNSAIETLRYTAKHNEVIEVDKEEEKVLSEDSSIEEVEILEDERDQKWKESNGVLEDPEKFDGTNVERDSRPSSSSAVTNLSSENLNLKVDSLEKLLESLQCNGEMDLTDARAHTKLLYLAERRNDKLRSLKYEIELKEKQWQVQQLLRPQPQKKEDVVAIELKEKQGHVQQLLRPQPQKEEDVMAMELKEKQWHIQQLLRPQPQKKEDVVAMELKEKQWHVQQLLRPQPQKKEDVVAEAFKPLTKEEETVVAGVLCSLSRRNVLVSHETSNISITGEVLRCLKAGECLNDEVINIYLELLKEREKREPHKFFLRCHFFNTFFYNKLTGGTGGYNFQSVRRWTSRRQLGYCIYDCDKIFIPIHKPGHWCLGVINKKDKKFQYLDSSFRSGDTDSQVMKAMCRYIKDEVKDKSGKEIDVSCWQKEEYIMDLPLQKNGFDCGMFMIKYADFYSRDIGLCFSQEHMPYFRLRTAKEILSLKAE